MKNKKNKKIQKVSRKEVLSIFDDIFGFKKKKEQK